MIIHSRLPSVFYYLPLLRCCLIRRLDAEAVLNFISFQRITLHQSGDEPHDLCAARVNNFAGACHLKAVSYTHLTLPTTPYV